MMRCGATATGAGGNDVISVSSDGAALNGTLAAFGALLYGYGIAFALGTALGAAPSGGPS